jgi:LPS-assembly protein
MKNKFKIYIFFLLFGCINTTSIVFANDFIFDSAQINVSENGNLINASNGKAKTLDGTVEVIAKNFIYVKDEAKLTATGEVILKDLINKITIKSEVLILNTNSNIIKSNTDSVIEDSSGNIIFTKKFLFTQYDRLIKIDNAKIIDIKKNNYTISQAYIDLNSNKLIGKDVSIDFNNLYFEKDNEPRVKGNTISSIQNQTTITKGVFTTCKKNDDCPPWQISAKEIRHDKEKKNDIL